MVDDRSSQEQSLPAVKPCYFGGKCIDTHAYLESLWIPSLRKELLQVDSIAVSLVVELEGGDDAMHLFAYLNGADSCTKQQRIVFEWMVWKKRSIDTNIIVIKQIKSVANWLGKLISVLVLKTHREVLVRQKDVWVKTLSPADSMVMRSSGYAERTQSCRGRTQTPPSLLQIQRLHVPLEEQIN